MQTANLNSTAENICSEWNKKIVKNIKTIYTKRYIKSLIIYSATENIRHYGVNRRSSADDKFQRHIQTQQESIFDRSDSQPVNTPNHKNLLVPPIRLRSEGGGLVNKKIAPANRDLKIKESETMDYFKKTLKGYSKAMTDLPSSKEIEEIQYSFKVLDHHIDENEDDPQAQSAANENSQVVNVRHFYLYEILWLIVQKFLTILSYHGTHILNLDIKQQFEVQVSPQ